MNKLVIINKENKEFGLLSALERRKCFGEIEVISDFTDAFMKATKDDFLLLCMGDFDKKAVEYIEKMIYKINKNIKVFNLSPEFIGNMEDDTVAMLVENMYNKFYAESRENIERKIYLLLKKMGFSANTNGYTYIYKALSLLMQDDMLLQQIYLIIGESTGTNDRNIERAIRISIEKAWKKGKNDDFVTETLGEQFCNNTPTNSEFLKGIAYYFKMES